MLQMAGMDPRMQQMAGMDPRLQQQMAGMDPRMQQQMAGMDPRMQQYMAGRAQYAEGMDARGFYGSKQQQQRLMDATGRRSASPGMQQQQFAQQPRMPFSSAGEAPMSSAPAMDAAGAPYYAGMQQQSGGGFDPRVSSAASRMPFPGGQPTSAGDGRMQSPAPGAADMFGAVGHATANLAAMSEADAGADKKGAKGKKKGKATTTKAARPRAKSKKATAAAATAAASSAAQQAATTDHSVILTPPDSPLSSAGKNVPRMSGAAGPDAGNSRGAMTSPAPSTSYGAPPTSAYGPPGGGGFPPGHPAAIGMYNYGAGAGNKYMGYDRQSMTSPAAGHYGMQGAMPPHMQPHQQAAYGAMQYGGGGGGGGAMRSPSPTPFSSYQQQQPMPPHAAAQQYHPQQQQYPPHGGMYPPQHQQQQYPPGYAMPPRPDYMMQQQQQSQSYQVRRQSS